MDGNQLETTREISSVNKFLNSLRRFCIAILQHHVLLHIIAFKVCICIMDWAFTKTSILV